MKLLLFFTFSIFMAGNVFPQWTNQNSGTSATLNSVFFLNDQLGWIACDNGNILLTQNGGSDWNTYTIASGAGINYISFISSQIGFATVGSKIYKSTDGGKNWQPFLNYPGLYLDNIYFVNNSLGFILASPHRILKTNDSGLNWNEILVDSVFNFNKLYFKNETTGWASVAEGFYDGGSIYKTIDGGETWSKIFSSNDRLFEVTGFSNSDTLFCMGSTYASHNTYNKLYTSKDGGNSWSVVTTPLGPRLIYFSTPNFGRILGQFGMSILNQKILVTNDGGNHWATEDSTTTEFVRVWFFANSNNGWAVGYDGLLKHCLPNSLPVENTIQNNSLQLFQNYPNPFNPETKIEFNVHSLTKIEIVVYSILGEKIVVLTDKFYPTGNYSVSFNGSGLSSGLYLYQINGAGQSIAKKMFLLK